MARSTVIWKETGQGIPEHGAGSGEVIGIRLMRRIGYGKHLEAANDGGYAILKPTVEGLRAVFFEAARKAFGGRR